MWAILSIAIIDLTLSGDNAAVIGLAIRKLSPHDRKVAAMIGAGGAIVLRVVLTALATVLLEIPYLNVLGGAILVWITWKLLVNSGDESGAVAAHASFWGAIGTIVVADLSMSFDNIMGVAGAAQGNILLLVFGLLISIPILVAGSSIIATLMNRYPILIYGGGAVLAHTAVSMFFHDKGLGLTALTGNTAALLIPWVIALVVFVWGWAEVRKERAGLAAEVAAMSAAASDTPDHHGLSAD